MADRKPAGGDKEDGRGGGWDVEEVEAEPRRIQIPLSIRARLLLLQAAFLAMVVLATNTMVLQALNTSASMPPVDNESQQTAGLHVLLDQGFDRAGLDGSGGLDQWYVEGGVLGEDGLVLNVSQHSTSYASIDDFQGGRGCRWQYVSITFQITYSGSEGEAFRAWGLIDSFPSHPRNSLCFVQYPSESDPSLVGFKAQIAIDGNLTHSTPIHITDTTSPHNYTIIWEPDNATFQVDGQTILAAGKAPQCPLGIMVLIAPWAYTDPPGPGNVAMTTVIDLEGNAWIQVSRITVFTTQQGFQEYSADVSRILQDAEVAMQTAQQRGLDIQSMRENHAHAQEGFGDGYVHAQLLETLRATAYLLPEYLDDLAQLFTQAREKLQAPGLDPRDLQAMETQYSLAQIAWEDIDLQGTLEHLQRIVEEQ